MDKMKYALIYDLTIRIPMCSYLSLNAMGEILSGLNSHNAIYIASPMLYNEMQKVKINKIKNKKEIQQIKESLTRYLTRMSTRCTPFGLFAGCAIGEFTSETNIQIKDSLRRTTRLDMYYLCVLPIHF